MITFPTPVTRILFVVPSFALIFSCMSSEDFLVLPACLPRALGCDVVAMSPVSPGRDDLADGVFAARVSTVLKFAQPESALMHSESAPMHFLAADNLGLARLFISKVFVDTYSRDMFSEALIKLCPVHNEFVQAVQKYEKSIPGMTTLHEAISETSDYLLAQRVELFAHGAVTLYAFAIAQGGTEFGYDLSYVREHIGVSAGTQQITKVIHAYMPYVIIKVLSEFTQELKKLYAWESDDELCSQFWIAVSVLNVALINGEESTALSPAQNEVFQLILTYQKCRIQEYKDLFAENMLKLSDRLEAARACEAQLLDNGLL